MRDRAYGDTVEFQLMRGVRIAQFRNLDEDQQRSCVDCIGHSWRPNLRVYGAWISTVCPALGLGSGGGGFDPESGFFMATAAQVVKLVRSLLVKVEEIEEQLSENGSAVVACEHGSNRSFLVVNLFMQKWHEIDYETARQLLCSHRNVKVRAHRPGIIVQVL